MQKVNCFLCHSTQNKTLIKISRQISNETFSISQCECGFSFLNPRPSEEELSKYYTEEEYYPHSKGRGIFYRLYSVARKITYHWKLRVIRKYTDEDIDHLDYGSGDGSFSKFLNSKKNISSLSYDPYFNNSRSLETSEKKYNTITLWHVLEHIYDLNNFFEELNDLLTNNGKIFLAVPNFNSLEKKYFNEDWAAYDLPRHLYHFNHKTLDRLLELKGYKIIKRKRMLLDTFYISMLSSTENNNIGMIKAVYISIIVVFKVLLKGPLYSSSLFYVCEKNK